MIMNQIAAQFHILILKGLHPIQISLRGMMSSLWPPMGGQPAGSSPSFLGSAMWE